MEQAVGWFGGFSKTECWRSVVSFHSQGFVICSRLATRWRLAVWPIVGCVCCGTKFHGVPPPREYRPGRGGVFAGRDLVADWKKWSRAERILAVVGTLLRVALPFGLLMTG